MFEAIAEWVHRTDNWLASALPFLGAFIAHVKATEKTEDRQTWKWHVLGYFVKLMYAVFAALMVGQAAAFYQLGAQLTYIAIGFCSAFAKEAVDLVWSIIVSVLKRKALAYDRQGENGK
jgi:hypothetical protein